MRLKHKWTWSKAKFELQIKVRGWVTTKWNASIANEFSFYFFLFSNGGYKLQKFFHFHTHKVEFKMFAEEFSRKREGILISLQSYSKLVAFRTKLKVVESERLMCGWMKFSCEIICNSKWKVKSKFSFHLCKSKVFKI